LAVKVRRIMSIYLSLTMSLVVLGVAYRLAQPEYHLRDWWAGVLFLAANLYVFLPVAWLAARRRAPVRVGGTSVNEVAA
jgi:hypothetical protein